MRFDTARETNLAQVELDALQAIGIVNGTGLVTVVLAAAERPSLWPLVKLSGALFVCALLLTTGAHLGRLRNHSLALLEERRRAPLAAAEAAMDDDPNVDNAVTYMQAKKSYSPLPRSVGERWALIVRMCGGFAAALAALALLSGAFALWSGFPSH